MNKDSISLLASVAVFKKLFNKSKDIYDIIAEFIKETIYSQTMYTFLLSEIRNAVCSKFNFEIPESVFRMTLKKRLNGMCKFDSANQRYRVETSLVGKDQVTNLAKKEQESVNKLITSLMQFLHEKGLVLSESETFDRIKKYLLGESIFENERLYISEFVINHKEDDLNVVIDEIKEGLVIYTGIQYSPKNLQDAFWPTKLTIYLDTEILFNICGYNGEYHKQKTNTLINYIKELNAKKQSISLRYFSETKQIVDNLFTAAANDIKYENIPVIQNSANKFILKYSKDDPSKVVELQTKLFDDLKIMSITEDDLELKPEDNMANQKLLDDIRIAVEKKSFEFDERKCLYVLSVFSKISKKRNGGDPKSFEDVNYIFLTETSLTKYIAFKENDNLGSKFFATDEDFLINKFWFRLNKGFGSQGTSTFNFNMLIQAKMIISAYLSEKIYETFDDLRTKSKAGKISQDALKSQLVKLHELQKRPEDVDTNDFPVADFLLKNKDIEDFIAMQAEQDLKKQKGDAAIELVEKIKLDKRRKNIDKKKKKKKNISITLKAVASLMAIMFCLALYLALQGVFFLGQTIMENVDQSFVKDFYINLFILFVTSVVSLSKAHCIVNFFLKFHYNNKRRLYKKFIKTLDYSVFEK